MNMRRQAQPLNKFSEPSYGSPQEAVMGKVLGNTIHWPRTEMSKGKGPGRARSIARGRKMGWAAR